MTEALFVIGGLFLLIALNFLGTWAFISIYLYSAKKKEDMKKVLIMSSFMALINVTIKMLVLIFTQQFGFYVVIAIDSILSIAAYYWLLKYKYEYHLLEIIIIAATLTFFFSPVWFKIFGIL